MNELPVIIFDSREGETSQWAKWLVGKATFQRNWSHPALKKPACLPTSDYCLPDAFSYDEASKEVLFKPRRIVERKTREDAYGCITSSRDRFEAELIRMYDLRLQYGTQSKVVIECTWQEFFYYATVQHDMNAKACIETFKKWERRWTEFTFAGSEQRAAIYAFVFLTGAPTTAPAVPETTPAS